MSYSAAGPNPLSEVDCLQLRVIPVDEDGNESAPSYPAYKWVGDEFEDDPDATAFTNPHWESISYPLSQCSAPAPAAPSGLAASYTDMPDPDRCRSTLSWNQVDPTNTDISYDVYRMVFTWRQGNPPASSRSTPTRRTGRSCRRSRR